MLPNETVELCQTLIRRPSVTPDDKGCQQLLGDRLKAAGFTLENLRFGEVDNLWARRGTEGPLLAFAGHTDVVPTGNLDQWSHGPFDADIVGDTLYGRGAADMKGGVAAMVTAAERFVQQHSDHKGSIAFLLTSDEEGPAVDGTVKVVKTLEARSEKIDWCIIGEPSSTATLGDIIKNGRRGSLGGHLIIKGKQGHVAYPHLASNPVHKALQALQALVTTEWDQGNEFFPATSLQISNINAGTGATNVIPGQLNIRFNLRYSSELSAETIQQKTSAILDSHKLDYDLEWNLSGLPFITQPGDLTTATLQSIEQICGTQGKLDTGGGTSDGRFIAPTGAQVIELGPCNASIHQVDENVSCTELEQLSQVYQNILQRLLS